jgi:hypothetical protein
MPLTRPNREAAVRTDWRNALPLFRPTLAVILAIGMSSPQSASTAWPVGAIIGLIIGWILVRASYYMIKWSLVVLGIFVIGDTL